MEETQATDTGETVVTEPTLDEVISEYSVQAPPTPPQSDPPVTATAADIVARVDPLDETAFQTYTQQVARNQTALNSQLREMSEKLTQIEQRDSENRIEADISDAVGTINSSLNLDPKLVRVHLEYTAQEKPGFKKVWENRHNDPTTYQKALAAVGREMSGLYAVKQDSELTETQAALQNSAKSLASKTSQNEKTTAEGALSQAENQNDFDREWQTLIGGNG